MTAQDDASRQYDSRARAIAAVESLRVNKLRRTFLGRLRLAVEEGIRAAEAAPPSPKEAERRQAAVDASIAQVRRQAPWRRVPGSSGPRAGRGQR